MDSFYCSGTQEELEDSLRAWLRATIRRLEEERARKENLDAKAAPTYVTRVQRN